MLVAGSQLQLKDVDSKTYLLMFYKARSDSNSSLCKVSFLIIMIKLLSTCQGIWGILMM